MAISIPGYGMFGHTIKQTRMMGSELRSRLMLVQS